MYNHVKERMSIYKNTYKHVLRFIVLINMQLF